MSTREFPVSVVLTVSTGYLVCENFGDAHELMEHLAGEPIWIHQMANLAFAERLSDELIKQHPALAGERPVFDGIPREAMEEACREYVRSVIKRLGVTHLPVETVNFHVPFTAGLEHLGKNRRT